MKKLIPILCTAALMAAYTVASAQSVSVNSKFGKVSKDELEMVSYGKDTFAVALVLLDKSNISIEFDATGAIRCRTRKHVRIKVLKEAGISYGDVAMSHYYSTYMRDVISNIDVETFNLVDGKVVSTKMPKKYVFDEDYVENYKMLKFSAQDVRVGSVIEMKYDIYSDFYWIIDKVFFQRSIPVNLAECEVRMPDWFSFNRKMYGYHHASYTSSVENSSVSIGGAPLNFTVNVDKYKAVDLPAFKNEPFMYNGRQYMSAVQYDIRNMSIPGVMYEDFSVTWEAVDEDICESDFMTRFRASCQFKDEMAQLMSSFGDDDRVNIASVVSFVKNRVSWNKEYVLRPDVLSKVVKSRSGSNADINCLIAGCLRQAGYVVEPVLVKPRSEGVLLNFQPERDAFSTFVLRVVGKDGSVSFLDGGSSNGYLNVLPPDFLVENARILRTGNASEWVNLNALCANGTRVSVNARLTEDLTMDGTITVKSSNQESYSIKNAYNSYASEDEYITELENDYGFGVESFEAEGLEEYSPSVTLNYGFTKEMEAGDRIYVNPMLLRFHSKDSFQSMTREYPIDFPYPYTVSYMFTFEIPEGYVVEELPENALITAKEIDSKVTLSCIASGNVVRIVYNYSQKSMIGNPSDYAVIREYWKHLNDMYESVIVLRKTN